MTAARSTAVVAVIVLAGCSSNALTYRVTAPISENITAVMVNGEPQALTAADSSSLRFTFQRDFATYAAARSEPPLDFTFSDETGVVGLGHARPGLCASEGVGRVSDPEDAVLEAVTEDGLGFGTADFLGLTCNFGDGEGFDGER